MSGLSSNDINIICNILKKYAEVEEACFFGSRAKGTQKTGSDVDIAIKGKIPEQTATRISGELNDESPLPYTFDIVDFNSLENQALKEHIERVGVSFYKKL